MEVTKTCSCGHRFSYSYSVSENVICDQLIVKCPKCQAWERENP